MTLSSRLEPFLGCHKRWLIWCGRKAFGRGSIGFVILLVVVSSIGNAFWLQRHFLTIPPPWDQGYYLYMGVRYWQAFSEHGVGAMLREFIRLSPDVAPLFPLTSLPLYLVFGPSRLATYMTNTLYLLFLLSGVYLLAAFVYGRRAGLLAAFVMATFTATINYSRDYLLEFPAAAFATLGMYALMRSAEFRHRSWCLTFGVLAGLTVLTKTMTGVFFVGPVLWGIGRSLWQRRFDAAMLTNGLLALSTGALVAGIWWGPNLRTALGYLLYYGFQEGANPYRGGAAIFTLENVSYYARMLVNHGTSFPYASLFVAVTLWQVIRLISGRHDGDAKATGNRGEEGQLWAWLLIGYVILTLVPNKGEERFAQPLLPPIAVLLAGAIQRIERPWGRRLLMGLVIAIGIFNYLGLTFGLPSIPRRLEMPPLAFVSHEYPHYTWVRSKISATPAVPWRVADLLSDLAVMYHKHQAGVEKDGFGGARNRYANVLVVPDHPQLNASTLRYYAAVDRLPLQFARILDGPITAERLQQYEFILVKQGGYQGPEFSTRYNDAIQALLLQGEMGFVALPEPFAFPDGAAIIVYVAAPLLR